LSIFIPTAPVFLPRFGLYTRSTFPPPSPSPPHLTPLKRGPVFGVSLALPRQPWSRRGRKTRLRYLSPLSPKVFFCLPRLYPGLLRPDHQQTHSSHRFSPQPLTRALFNSCPVFFRARPPLVRNFLAPPADHSATHPKNPLPPLSLPPFSSHDFFILRSSARRFPEKIGIEPPPPQNVPPPPPHTRLKFPPPPSRPNALSQVLPFRPPSTDPWFCMTPFTRYSFLFF